ncbi:MAG TPA: aminopeptidase N [Dokdonella sp.]|uniref:aminopeptidase N n=1 Tax=Dokdonella sp. TaxID=2291710 RepID=UPI002D7F1D2A|nr:aminopeptidase N [Dokdonella sp.]HET9032949.1 aminopeptidase N [Dokdonella sp.]
MGKPVIYLDDYKVPAWRMETVKLSFDLDPQLTTVHACLTLSQDPAQEDVELSLDGENIELVELRVDGRLLEFDEYCVDERGLCIPGMRGKVVIDTCSRIRPSENSAMLGVYLSGGTEKGFLLSQCEAEGFRHVTWSIDRPDVLARYEVTLRADRARFPVLLAGGNPAGSGELADGRHWARFVDPQPKPAYLFALVAGQLDAIEDVHVTAEGRRVRLLIWADAAVVERCRHAMACLKAAMVWDEQNYGRNYQLDVFHVVATDDFTMGAMENTGLNIFNSRYLLADPLHATDDDYRHVLAVVAHEYFHNWTGNRITCRDWFQLCLKEGLTVYREQEFVSDEASRTLRRIEDVRILWRAQFSEDAGPLAHPVRPSSYTEINNFYTATVYEKGAEIVRMLATHLGKDGFRRGMDLYFDRHDGEAVTVEDFLAALGDANGCDLSAWLVWYTEAGTPMLEVSEKYDPLERRFELSVIQHRPATETQATARPIPLAAALFDDEGKPLALHREDVSPTSVESVLLLDGFAATFRFEQVPSKPILSLLRGFSAPVRIARDQDWGSLATLVGHDSDSFNRWLAGDALALRCFLAAMDGDPSAGGARDAWLTSLLAAFDTPDLDPATLAEMLTLADEATLSDALSSFDPDAVHEARTQLEVTMARRLESALLERYRTLAPASLEGMQAAAQARRRLRNRCLALLCRADEKHHALACSHYDDAVCLSDKLAALICLVHGADQRSEQRLKEFAAQYSAATTVMDKWFSVQATIPHRDTLHRVDALTRHEAFLWNKPNKIHALVLGFALRNPLAFHRQDGLGYRFAGDAICRVDKIMPQVAARLATAFAIWPRVEPQRRQLMRLEMQRIQRSTPLSTDLADILSRSLAAST